MEIHDGNIGLLLGWSHLVLGIICIFSRNIDFLLIGLYGVIVGTIVLIDYYQKKKPSNNNKDFDYYQNFIEFDKKTDLKD